MMGADFHAEALRHSVTLAAELMEYTGTYVDVKNDLEFIAVADLHDALAQYIAAVESLPA